MSCDLLYVSCDQSIRVSFFNTTVRELLDSGSSTTPIADLKIDSVNFVVVFRFFIKQILQDAEFTQSKCYWTKIRMDKASIKTKIA